MGIPDSAFSGKALRPPMTCEAENAKRLAIVHMAASLHVDQWLVSAQYFADNFEPVRDLTEAAE
jgi:hypothetical protein